MIIFWLGWLAFLAFSRGWGVRSLAFGLPLVIWIGGNW
jgi:hypothetical protein